MAMCEKCGSKGHDMREMQVDQENRTFVGPCCVTANPAQLFEKDEVAYGVEFSSHMGLKAYASYGGLTLEFKKTAKELQEWVSPAKTQEETTQDTPPDLSTSGKPLNRTEMPN